MSVTILASRYNNLRNLVNQVLGVSAGIAPTYGYGQNFSTNGVVGSREVSNLLDADKISAKDYEDLYIDLIRTRSHQVGSSVAIDEFVIGDYETNTETADKIEEAYILGLESLANNIAADRFNVAPEHLTIDSLPNASSTRPSTLGFWNGTLSHVFTVTFNNDVERRHFFNAGGEIRLSASVDYTGSQAKTVDWQIILNAMGTISFKAQETVANAGFGTGSSIGNYNLTNTYQLVYSRTGGSIYARNRYNIYAAESVTIDNTSQIKFRVEFVDDRPNNLTWGIDESVLGTFNSTVQTATPSSQITINGTQHNSIVIDDIPVGKTERTLSGLNVPTYSLSSPVSINEGNSATFVVATLNVNNNTQLYWDLNPISSGQPVSSDFTNGVTSGSTVINNNTGSIVIPVASDATTEGTEQFSVNLRTNSISGTIVATSSVVDILDTSTTPVAPPPDPVDPVDPDPVPPPVYVPPPPDFTFSVTPTQTTWDFTDRLDAYPGDGQLFTMTGTGGSGTVTVQETNRPSAWNVYVDNIVGSNSPASTATKDFTLSNGQSKTVVLNVKALTIGSGKGSFAFVGGGQTIFKSWTGTATPPLPTINFSPSTGNINDTNFTVTWDDQGAGSRTVSVSSPEGTTILNTANPTGSVTEKLGVLGTWTGTITTPSGSASDSVTVNPTPPPPVVIPAPSISFSPSSGTINETQYTLTWNANGAPSATITVTNSNGETTVLNDLSGSITSTLGVLGTWSATIVTSGGTSSDSVTVSAPPPPPTIPPPVVIPPPSVSFGPGSGIINSTVFTLSWNANGGSFVDLVLTNPLGERFEFTDLSGSVSSTLGVVGQWSAVIRSTGGISASSVGVTAA